MNTNKPTARHLRAASLRAGRGSAYVVVLTTTSMITLIALTSFSLASNAVEEASSGADAESARALAHGAVEIGINQLQATDNWRQTLPTGEWVSSLPFGDGTLTVTAIDPADGNIANNPVDPLIIRGAGRVGDATQHLEVKLVPVPMPSEQATSSLVVMGSLNLASASVIAEEPTHVGGSAAFFGSDFDGTINVAGTVTGNAGSRAIINTPPSTPAVSFDTTEYTERVTAQTLPSNTLRALYLGPRYASHGLTASEHGTYHLNISGTVEIEELVVKGTLIVSGTGTLILRDTYRLEPHRPGWPALVTSTELLIEPTDTDFRHENEADDWFDDNGNRLDVEINGPVYVTQDAIINGVTEPVVIAGTLAVGGSATLSGDLEVKPYDDDNAIPPRTATNYSTMAIVEGSWRRWVD